MLSMQSPVLIFAFALCLTGSDGNIFLQYIGTGKRPYTVRKLPLCKGLLKVERQAECSFLEELETCDFDNKYRTPDGSCNNIKHPRLGSSFQPHIRILPPEYGPDDGIKEFNPESGNKLPSARSISKTALTTATSQHNSVTVTNMYWSFGQFIDHDITLTPSTPRPSPNCCVNDSPAKCINIDIPVGDPDFTDCMEVTRSTSVSPGDCGAPNQEQMNALTPFIDASNVYGSTNEVADALRTYESGRMETSLSDGLPLEEGPSDGCLLPENLTTPRCPFAGDIRVGEWHGLTSLHTVFLKWHNQIADEFYKQLAYTALTEEEKDEIIYQEARRIVGATLQAITYRDFLPIALGDCIMRRYRLNLRLHVYKPYTDPRMSNAFSTAAFRFGHNLIQDAYRGRDVDFTSNTEQLDLMNSFFNVDEFDKMGYDSILRALVTDPASAMDSSFVNGVHNKLFIKNLNNGFDLAALNIQRGRDHGLPSYNSYRKRCGLKRIVSFDHMPDHNDEVAQRLKKAYKHPDDMDLFIAGVTETPLDDDALLGPTFACIIADQFKRVKEADRFWFESAQTHPFTRRQLHQLRKLKLAKILCDTSDSTMMPVNVFRIGSPIVHCSKLRGLDLKNWFAGSRLSSLKLVAGINKRLRRVRTRPSTGDPISYFGRIKIN